MVFGSAWRLVLRCLERAAPSPVVSGAVDWCGTGSALTLDYTGHGASGGGGFSLFLAGRSRSDFKTHKLKHPELAADLD